MNQFVAGFCSALFLTGAAFAQTPTPIQPRKITQPPPQANSVTVLATPQPTVSTPKVEVTKSYCANSMRVFRGIGAYNPEYRQYSINFNYKLCFTEGKNEYKISRIFLLPEDPYDYSQYFWTSIVNQPIRLVLLNYKVVKIGDSDEIIARRFDIVRDD